MPNAFFGHSIADSFDFCTPINRENMRQNDYIQVGSGLTIAKTSVAAVGPPVYHGLYDRAVYVVYLHSGKEFEIFETPEISETSETSHSTPNPIPAMPRVDFLFQLYDVIVDKEQTRMLWKYFRAADMESETEAIPVEDQVAAQEVVGSTDAKQQFERSLVEAEDHINIYKDGDQWCALHGVNLQEGTAGFGDTPGKALQPVSEALTSAFLEFRAAAERLGNSAEEKS